MAWASLVIAIAGVAIRPHVDEPLRRADLVVDRGITRRTWSSVAAGVRERRGRLATDDRRCFVDELVVLEGLDHEQRKVHAAGEVALEDGIADVPAPHRQALTLALLEVTAAHDGP